MQQIIVNGIFDKGGFWLLGLQRPVYSFLKYTSHLRLPNIYSILFDIQGRIFVPHYFEQDSNLRTPTWLLEDSKLKTPNWRLRLEDSCIIVISSDWGQRVFAWINEGLELRFKFVCGGGWVCKPNVVEGFGLVLCVCARAKLFNIYPCIRMHVLLCVCSSNICKCKKCIDLSCYLCL